TVLHLALRSEHQHRGMEREPAQFGAKSVSVEFRQHDIEQYQVGLLPGCLIETGLAVRRREHAVAFGIEDVGEGDSHGWLILDDQDACSGIHAIGNSSAKRLPWSTALFIMT